MPFKLSETCKRVFCEVFSTNNSFIFLQEYEGMSDRKLYMKAMNQMFERMRLDLANQIGDLVDQIDKMESSYHKDASTTNTRNRGRHE